MTNSQVIVVPMQTSLGLSSDQANAIQYIPAASSLLVVFLAGLMTDRWGARKVLLMASGIYTLGAVLVSLSSGLGMALIGRSLSGVGSSTMTVGSLSLIHATLTNPAERAKAFSLFGAMKPGVFLLTPLLSAMVVEATNWRLGVALCAVVGTLCCLSTWRWAPRRAYLPGRNTRLSLLAGIALAAIALGITTAGSNTSLMVTSISVGIASLLGLLLLLGRRVQHSPEPLLPWARNRRMVLVSLAVMAASMPNLLFCTNLLLQYRYQAPLVTIVLLLVVPQACGVAGGLAAGPISRRYGAPWATTAGLVLSAVTSLALLLVEPQAPIWVPVLAVTISAAPMAFVMGPITETFLDQTPRESAGIASSLRNATSTLGGCLGGALIGALGFGVFEHRLAQMLETTSLTSLHAQNVAQQIRAGATVKDLVSSIPDLQVKALLTGAAPALHTAQINAYQAMGLSAALIYLFAALLLTLSRRPQRGTCGHANQS
jgi:predicted MFS family arabinose efflux permease